jgi:EAL domain-containing protein (putative c-di-GMP-specific phosphodiesterase class I)
LIVFLMGAPLAERPRATVARDRPLGPKEAEVELERALESGELEVHYQPIVELGSGRITGLEALVRWRHPSRGLVLPSEFVPLAEQTGQVLALGVWVLAEACRQTAAWRAMHATSSGLEIAVNLSGEQMSTPGLVDVTRAALRSADLEPSSLLLEITETALIRDTAGSIAALDSLRALGVRIALDDFGTGFSSLQYLDRFPVDTMKIAQAFVNDVGEHTGREPRLARAIVGLAEAFDLRVIAEGVERPDQVPALIELGCDLGQGNLFSPAVSAERADALLRAGSVS